MIENHNGELWMGGSSIYQFKASDIYEADVATSIGSGTLVMTDLKLTMEIPGQQLSGKKTENRKNEYKAILVENKEIFDVD